MKPVDLLYLPYIYIRSGRTGGAKEILHRDALFPRIYGMGCHILGKSVTGITHTSLFMVEKSFGLLFCEY